jgi:hypothetical protein
MGHDKQESTTFILSYGSNKQHHMDKEEFHWLLGVVQGWFSAKLGSKISDGSQLSAQFPCPPQPQGHNKQESTTFILPYGSNKHHCMCKRVCLSFCGVVQGWFSAKLGSKISDGSQLSAQFPCDHQQPQGHNKQETTTFILPYGSSKRIVWTRKSFIGSLVSCRVGFQQNLGQKSVVDPSCQHNFLLATNSHMGHNKQESTTFILSYGSNKQHHMDKEEFHWLFGVLQGWFSTKLGSKIIDGSQLSAQFPWPPTATGT